ncbi:hypothetical protein ABTE31_20715, partial [Acinetobacter baumannii]
AFCRCMPPALMDMPHLKIDGETMTARAALSELTARTGTGQTIAGIIEAHGVRALTTPNEGRFRADR